MNWFRLNRGTGVSTPRPPSVPPCLPTPVPPADRASSSVSPQWLLGSSASCPGWHELMITAAASQSRLIHYVFLAGPAAGLRRFWHWMRKPGTAPFTAHTSNPPSHPSFFAAFYGFSGAFSHNLWEWTLFSFSNANCKRTAWDGSSFPKRLLLLKYMSTFFLI